LEAVGCAARKELSVDDFKKLVGKEVGTSSWHEITQQRVNAFADATGDHQVIIVIHLESIETL
jgi:acyl dehydratase